MSTKEKIKTSENYQDVLQIAFRVIDQEIEAIKDL